MTAADERFFVVGGRRWRRTDPAIPEPLRVELVRELMSARREQARARVQDAKVALGERGRPWWEPFDAEGLRPRVVAAVRSLLQARGPSKSICPSDAARVAGGGEWRQLVPVARDVARDLARDGAVVVTAGGERLDPTATWSGPVRIRLSEGTTLR